MSNTIIKDSSIKDKRVMTEKEINDMVSGKTLYAMRNFSIFAKYEPYVLEYMGNDVYVGKSDNILDMKVKITPDELRFYFSDHIPYDIFKDAKFGDRYVYEDRTGAYECIFCDEFLNMNNLGDTFYELVCIKPYVDERGETSNEVLHIYSPANGHLPDGETVRKPKLKLMSEEYLLGMGYEKKELGDFGKYGYSVMQYTSPDSMVTVSHAFPGRLSGKDWTVDIMDDYDNCIGHMDFICINEFNNFLKLCGYVENQ